jgi:hypothetical protein
MSCAFSWQHPALGSAQCSRRLTPPYARFSSQWSYLAGVYNQIKAAECRTGFQETVLAQWKAGFIEDAADLHLLRKAMFASINQGSMPCTPQMLHFRSASLLEAHEILH